MSETSSAGISKSIRLSGASIVVITILILDEPTSLLDPKTASEFMELMNKLCRENGISIIIVEHRLDLVLKYADRLIILSNGKIVSNDKPENVFNYKKLIIPELGIPFSTKIYRELAKAHVEFSKPVTCADDMINEVRKKS